MSCYQRLLLLLLGALLIDCTPDSNVTLEDPYLSSLGDKALNIGALICINSPFGAKAPGLERTVILAEEYLNGLAQAYPDLPEASIPCRQTKTCGAWVGTDASGKPIRGPLRLIISDSGERPQRGISAADEMVHRFNVPVIIGPCSAEVAHAIYKNVTKTERVLITPIVTADSLTEINDRTDRDLKENKSGYVFRTITPDYIQAEVLAQIGTNLERDPVLIRDEDQTKDECTDQSDDYCETKFKGQGTHKCLASPIPRDSERQFFKFSTMDCQGQEPSYCDMLGKNYLCLEHPTGSGKKVCSQYKVRRYCTKVITPKVAMILYPETDVGQTFQQEVEKYWVDLKGNVATSISYKPDSPVGFADVIKNLFSFAAINIKEKEKEGRLPANYPLEDSVVFLLAQETEGALLLQEWSIQKDLLPRGSDRVLWLGTDALRSRIFLDHMNFDIIRNLFLIDPNTTDLNNAQFFTDLFQKRWGQDAGDYTANLFDTALLVALANEHAGALRAKAQPGKGLGPNTGGQIKDSLAFVSNGCDKTELDVPCPDSAPFSVYSPKELAKAMAETAQGLSVRLQGISGDLSLSPEGDRLNDLRLWRVDQAEGKKQFAIVRSYTPQAHGINLRK